MFDLIVAGKQYKVKDDFEAAMLIAEADLQSKISSGQKVHVALIFSICTGLPSSEAFEIIKELEQDEYVNLFGKMMQYCYKISMSRAERIAFDKRIDEQMKEKGLDEKKPTPKPRQKRA